MEPKAETLHTLPDHQNCCSRGCFCPCFVYIDESFVDHAANVEVIAAADAGEVRLCMYLEVLQVMAYKTG